MLKDNERAKQFQPFDALKGLQDALREKEIEKVEKKELTEESLKILSDKLMEIEINDIVKIKYYTNKQYKEIEGQVRKINVINKKIILDELTINFSDILEIERCA